MKEKISKITEKVTEQINDLTVDFLDKSTTGFFHTIDEMMKGMGKLGKFKLPGRIQ